MLKEILLAFSKKNTFEVYQLFKHVYEGNEILSTNEELSSMKKLTEKGVMLDIIPSLKFFDEMFNIEKVVEAKNTSLISDEREEQTLCMPCLLKIYKTVALCETYLQVQQGKYFNSGFFQQVNLISLLN